MTNLYLVPRPVTEKTQCARHDTWVASLREFQADPCRETKERMVGAYTRFYEAFAGTRMGLAAEVDKMQQDADRLIVARA